MVLGKIERHSLKSLYQQHIMVITNMVNLFVNYIIPAYCVDHFQEVAVHLYQTKLLAIVLSLPDCKKKLKTNISNSFHLTFLHTSVQLTPLDLLNPPPLLEAPEGPSI